MSAARDRKQAAKILGLTMQAQLRTLVEAQGNDAIQAAAIQLGDTFNRNSDFIVWVLKEFGGVQQPPYARPKPLASASARTLPPRPAPPKPANDLPVLPATLVGEPPASECTCPPMEEGIIGYKHMASCPQFDPV